jgi:hypothetical protein
MLKFVAFGDWLPDTPEYGEVALHREVNGLPIFGSFRPLLKKAVKASVADGPVTGAYAHYFQQTIQAQFLRPDSDVSNAGAWVLPDATTVFWTMIDEATASDADRFYSPGAPNAAALVVGLADGVAPGSTASHFVRYRYALENYGAAGNWSLVTRLLDAPRSVTSITRAGATATATQTAHGYTTGVIVRVAGATQSQYNGEFSITVTGANTYTYTVTGTPATPATGTILATAIWSKDTVSKLSVTSITRAGAVATVTTTTAHGWVTGETATIAGAAQAEYNVSAVITVTGASSFTYAVAGAPATPATGTITATNGVTTGAWSSVTHAVTTTEAGYMATAARWTALQVEFTATISGASAQILRPTSDVSVGGWTTDGGATSGLFGSIDETVASDVDYIQSAVLGVGQSATYEAGLGTGIDPYAAAGHVVRYRYKASNSGMTVTVALKQGTTTIASQSHASAATTFTNGALTLSGAQCDAITDFAALRLAVTASFPSATASTASQYASPVSDYDNDDGWENQAGSTSNIYQAIDEAVASDSDSIITPSSGGLGGSPPSSYIAALGSLTDPLTDAGHVLHFRWFPNSSSTPISLYLLQGSTRIATAASGELGTPLAWNNVSYTLTAAETNAITDYGQLRVEMVWAGGSSDVFAVSWLRLETPAPRRAQVSFAEVELPSASRIGVSWAEAEIPATNTTYQSDRVVLYAGTNTKLYEATAASFANVSIAGGYATGTINPVSWNACSWGEDVIFTNKVDPVQIRLAGAALFSNLITTPSPAPKGRFVTVVAEQVWLGDINLTEHYSDEVWWSAVGNAADFAKSPTTLSDYQRLRQIPGQVMGLVGGETATIFKRNGVLKATFVGAPKVYGISVLSSNVGTPFPHSIVTWGDTIFFRGSSDFYQIVSGSPPQKIGDGVLTKFLKDSAFSNESLLQSEPSDPRVEDQLVGGAVCGFSDLIAWTYQGKDDVAYRHSRMVFYDVKNGRWGFAKIAGLNQTLLTSNPNLANADENMLKGIIGFDWDGTNVSWFTYSGDQTYALELSSKIQTIVDGREVQINGIRPIYSIEKSQGDADALSWPELTISVDASRDARMLVEVTNETKSTSLSSPDRFVGFHIGGEFFRFRVTVPELTEAMMREFVGLHIDYVVSGGRG